MNNTINKTNFLEKFKEIYSILLYDKIEESELFEAIKFLKKYNFDINKENNSLNFYIEFLGKEDSLFLIGLSDYFLGYILDEVEEENDMEAPFKPRKTDMIYIDNF